MRTANYAAAYDLFHISKDMLSTVLFVLVFIA